MARTGWKYWLLGPEKQAKFEERAAELGFEQRGSCPVLPGDIEVERSVEVWERPISGEWIATIEPPIDHCGFRRSLGARMMTLFGVPLEGEHPDFELIRRERDADWLDWDLLREGRIRDAGPGIVEIAPSDRRGRDGGVQQASALRPYILGASPTAGVRVADGYAWATTLGRPQHATALDRFRDVASAVEAVCAGESPGSEPARPVEVEPGGHTDPFRGVAPEIRQWAARRELRSYSFGWLPVSGHVSIPSADYSYIQGAAFGALPSGETAGLAHYRAVTLTPHSSGNDSGEAKATLACTEIPEAAGWIGRVIGARQLGGRRIDALQDLLRDDHRVRLESIELDRRLDLFIESEADANRARQLFAPSFIVELLEGLPEGAGFEFADGVLSLHRRRDTTDPDQLDALWTALGLIARRFREEAVE